MNYVSTKTIESKTQGGARFVLKRMNDRRRQALRELQAEAAARVKPLLEELGPLNREHAEALKKARAVGAAERKAAIAGGATEAEAVERHPYGVIEFSDEKFLRRAELQDQIQATTREDLEPAALRFVVARPENYEIDGEPADVDRLLADGPDEFRQEISREVQRELGLLPEEAENLSSPSTSAAAVDGTTTTGSAASAGTAETTTAADAGSTTGPGNAIVPSTGPTR